MRTGQLPSATPDVFVGRDEEFGKLFDALESSRIVTILGPGGVGKTRFSQEAGRRISVRTGASTAFVDLSGLHAGDDVAGEIAAALSVFEDPPALVILDNCEQITGAVADWIASRPATASTSFVCTSREPLGASGEFLLPLSPLPTDQALLLLRQRAHAAGAESHEGDGSRRLVAALGGLPLAIEFAASRLRAMTPAELVEVVRSHDLTNPVRGVTQRRASLDASFDWSWELLTQQERDDLTCLSPIGQPFAAEEAAALLQEPIGPARLRLRELVDRSLLMVRKVGGVTQYVMLQPIRMAVMRKAREECPELYGLAVRRRAQQWVDAPPTESMTGVIDIVDQVEKIDPTLAVKVAIRTVTRLYLRHHPERARELLDRAIASCPDDLVAERIDLHSTAAAVWASHLHDIGRARAHVERAVSLSERHGVRGAEARNAEGVVALESGDFETAVATFRQAVGLASGSQQALSRANLGVALLQAGRFDDARAELRAALDGDLPASDLTVVRTRHAIAAHWAGHVDEARDAFRRAMEEGDEGVDRVDAQISSLRLGYTFEPPDSERLDPVRALDVTLVEWLRGFGDSADVREKLTEACDPLLYSVACAVVGHGSLKDGRPTDALEYLRRGAGQVPAGEPLLRAAIGRLCRAAATEAGRGREASMWESEVESALGAATAPLLDQAFGSIEEATRRRAEVERRYTPWSWVHVSDLGAPAPLAKSRSATAASPSWTFTTEARMAKLPSGKLLNLSRRGAMRKILWHLVERQRDAPGLATSVDEVFEVGWEGEMLDWDLALARVYNTIAALRGLGFEEILLTHDDGYLLDPTASVVISG